MKKYIQYIKESKSDYYYREKSLLDNRYYNFLNLIKMKRDFWDLYGKKYKKPLIEELTNLLLGKYVKFFAHEDDSSVNFPFEEKVESINVYIHNFLDYLGSDVIINGKVVYSMRLIRIEIINPNDDPYGEEDWEN